MFNKTLKIVCIFSILLLYVVNVEAKLVFTETELKEKISKNKILMLYLVDGGIGGVEKNQFNLPSEDFIIFGQYDSIPDEMNKLAQEHNVKIESSQQFNARITRNPWGITQLIAWLLYTLIFLGIFIMLILMNKKLSKILKVLGNQKEKENK